ncbi:MAG: 50S ribosomal protein L25/general stress protein Ctc [Bacteroidales bacterium]|nr:50S ribosomal protein L25/general stress protein Ctc [Bacteroidales bacterium]
MKTFEIKGNLRKDLGKKSSKKIRIQQQVPCVMYGGSESVHFSVPELSFKDVIYTPNVYLIKLDIDGTSYDTLLQDVQFHPVTDRILHVDFKEISFDKEVATYLPIKLVGDSAGIKEGGKLRLKRRKLKVKALPGNLPDFVEIDITNLEIGESVKIGEVVSDSLEMLDPHRSMIVAIASSRVAKGMEEAIEEEELVAEGEETEEGAAEASTEDAEVKPEE